MIKVSKFGGSSLSDAQQFKKVRAIIEADPKRKIVVVSASGKRNKEDNKITDLLYLCYAHLKYSVSCDAIWSMIEERYISIKQDLGLAFPIEQELSKLKDQLHKGMNEDFLVSRGEYLCALLLAEYLDYTFVDAADVILFDYSGKIDFEKSKQALEAVLKKHDRLVIPGFYGSLPDGEIRTLTRGGVILLVLLLLRMRKLLFMKTGPMFQAFW